MPDLVRLRRCFGFAGIAVLLFATPLAWSSGPVAGSAACVVGKLEGPPPPIRDGTLLTPQFKIQKHLASGGMGNIYLAEDLSHGNQICVVKETIDTTKEQANAKQFQKEGEILKASNSAGPRPGIPAYLGQFSAGYRHYIAMEFVKGEGLHHLLAGADAQRFGETQIRDIGAQIAGVIQVLHEHNPPIVYRDMKPANVIVKDDGQVVVVDFGAGEYTTTPGNQVIPIGTPGYAPKEQYAQRPVDPRSDIYALGKLLYYMTTGENPETMRNPFDLKPVSQIRPAVNQSASFRQLADAIDRAVSDRADQRPQTMAEFRKLLLGGKEPPAPTFVKGKAPEPVVAASSEKDVPTVRIQPRAVPLETLQKEIDSHFARGTASAAESRDFRDRFASAVAGLSPSDRAAVYQHVASLISESKQGYLHGFFSRNKAVTEESVKFDLLRLGLAAASSPQEFLELARPQPSWLKASEKGGASPWLEPLSKAVAESVDSLVSHGGSIADLKNLEQTIHTPEVGRAVLRAGWGKVRSAQDYLELVSHPEEFFAVDSQSYRDAIRWEMGGSIARFLSLRPAPTTHQIRALAGEYGKVGGSPRDVLESPLSAANEIDTFMKLTSPINGDYPDYRFGIDQVIQDHLPQFFALTRGLSNARSYFEQLAASCASARLRAQILGSAPRAEK